MLDHVELRRSSPCEALRRVGVRTRRRGARPPAAVLASSRRDADRSRRCAASRMRSRWSPSASCTASAAVASRHGVADRRGRPPLRRRSGAGARPCGARGAARGAIRARRRAPGAPPSSSPFRADRPRMGRAPACAAAGRPRTAWRSASSMRVGPSAKGGEERALERALVLALAPPRPSPSPRRPPPVSVSAATSVLESPSPAPRGRARRRAGCRGVFSRAAELGRSGRGRTRAGTRSGRCAAAAPACAPGAPHPSPPVSTATSCSASSAPRPPRVRTCSHRSN